MRIYLWSNKPDGPGAILPHAGHGPSLASVALHVNPLAGDPLPPISPGSRVVVFSGWATEGIGGGGETPGPFAWSPSAREAFDRWCDRMGGPLASAAAQVLFMPAAAHVLSDPQSCLTFLRARAGQPFGLMLDPALLLTPAMLGRAEDHLRRAMEALGRHPAVAALRLTNIQISRAEQGPSLRPEPLHRGVLDARLLASLAAAHTPPDLPLVLLPEQVETQTALLAAGAAPGNGG